MKNVEIQDYKEYVWGSIVRVKIGGMADHLISARVGVVFGAFVLVTILALTVGFVVGKFMCQ